LDVLTRIGARFNLIRDLIASKWRNFRLNYLKFGSKAETNYPIDILPSKDKKLIESNIGNCLIFRHFLEKQEIPVIDAETNYINQLYLVHPTSNLMDLSTNLFGIFTHKEGRIKIIGNDAAEFNTYCQADFDALIPVLGVDYIEENRLFWHILVGDVEKIVVEYPSLNKDSKSFTAKCLVMHTPMKWNYWHFSLRWWINEEGSTPFFLHSIEAKRQRKYIKKIATETRSILAKCSKLHKDVSHRTIEDYEYLKNESKAS
jgi:hypothetical protein